MIDKAPTGIPGFDEISRGGLPSGRVTLVVGGPGSGKTLFALETLVNGARLRQEAGVFVAFEENSRQIVANAATFGWDLPALERERLFFLDARLSPATIHGGEFDLGALLAALGAKCDELGAKRIVFDGLDVLLTLLDDPAAERREVYRLHEWLREREITGIMTAKSGDADRWLAERYAFMQFMVDCVVALQHRLSERVSIRTLRILKYRGSGFAENEFPIVISDSGIEVSSFGSPMLQYPASSERVSTGIARLDAMLAGGYYRGSSTLISGAPGTAKSTLAGAFVAAACERGERALWLSFDESAAQIARNLRSVGIDLAPHLASGRLVVHSVRTESRGAEEHLVDLRRRTEGHAPSVMVIDPISALAKTGGNVAAVHASLRMLDHARTRGITLICTSLVADGETDSELTATQISTIADTWIHLAYLVKGGERNRTLTIVKSRGTRHSNQVRELLIADDGVSLADVYTAGGEVLVGTARWEREAELREAERRRRVESERRHRELELVEAEVSARISALQRELETRRAELESAESEEAGRRDRMESKLGELRRRRFDDEFDAGGDGAAPRGGSRGATSER
ncbi:MAG TPA: circadian clock protein KaiC [Gemmatimonadaceae bacterium]